MYSVIIWTLVSCFEHCWSNLVIKYVLKQFLKAYKCSANGWYLQSWLLYLKLETLLERKLIKNYQILWSIYFLPISLQLIIYEAKIKLNLLTERRFGILELQKTSYKTKLGKMMSQFELLTWNFSQKFFSPVTNSKI